MYCVSFLTHRVAKHKENSSDQDYGSNVKIPSLNLCLCILNKINDLFIQADRAGK